MMEDSAVLFHELKACVIIPTYNNALTLERVLRGVLAYTDNVVVINDGSTDDTSKILAAFPSLTTVSYAKNKGKGFALRTAFHHALAAGYDYAISIDSDAQHFPDDLPTFLHALQQHRDTLIIGRRNMDQASVPGKSNFGRNFSNFWFTFETGIKIEDTQSGYRLYPIRRMQHLHFYTNKFEFEVEVIVRAAWADIPVIEVPVKVFYPEKEKRITHFRPFRDFSRISVLNTVLVTIALLYIKPRNFFRDLSNKTGRQKLYAALFDPSETDSLKAISVGFGVMMGIIPIWGFQLIAAIALAFAFKLNKALVVIAANISIPPMIPLILFLSHLTGAVWMGDHAITISIDKTLTLERIKGNFLQFIHGDLMLDLTDSFIQYILGAITLSLIAGVIFGVATYAILKLVRR